MSLRSLGLKLANAFGVILTYTQRISSTKVRQNTPKAFANLSPGFERSENPGVCERKIKLNPERVRRLANPFRVGMYFRFELPRLSLRSNLGLKLANAFGVMGWKSDYAFGVGSWKPRYASAL